MQFMGKDNVPFHTVIFPATLLGTGQKWTYMHSISVTEYLNYEGTQFSKSRGTGGTSDWQFAAKMCLKNVLPASQLKACKQSYKAEVVLLLPAGVFGNDAKETGIPVDVWRYYLLATRPEQQDTDFKWDDLQVWYTACSVLCFLCF